MTLVLRGTLLRHLGLAVVAGIVMAVVLTQVEPFTDYQLASVAFFAIAAAGLTVLTGLNGQLSLGHGALMAVGGYTTSLLLQRYINMPVVLAMVASVVAAAAAAVVVGAAAARLRGPYLAGATLALAVGLPGITVAFAGTFHGDQGIPVAPVIPPDFLGPDYTPERWIALVSLACALVTFVLLANLKRSRFGRDFRAIRDDEVAAALSGVRVARNRVTAFVLSGACAGLSGSLFALWAGITARSGFGLSLSLQLLAAVVIGGLGTLPGAIWGAFAVVFLPPLANNATDVAHLPGSVRDNLPLAIYGAVFMVTMLTFPNGIQGGIHLLRLRLRRLFRRGGNSVKAK